MKFIDLDKIEERKRIEEEKKQKQLERAQKKERQKSFLIANSQKAVSEGLTLKLKY